MTDGKPISTEAPSWAINALRNLGLGDDHISAYFNIWLRAPKTAPTSECKKREKNG